MKFSKWTGAMNSSKNPWTSPEITQIWLERGIPEAHSDKSLMPVVQKSYLGLLYSTETWTHSPRLGDLKHQLELYTSHDFMCTIIRWYWLTVKIWILHQHAIFNIFWLEGSQLQICILWTFQQVHLASLVWFFCRWNAFINSSI